jgi:alkylhydroperoxidase/carboxymuconolactone decarboxylase family protein YurZ
MPMSNNANHQQLGSAVLQSREIAATSHKFAEGFARVRDVTDNDGACPAWAKALYMACAASVRGLDDLLDREMIRARDLGLTLSDARGAALAVMISRGEGVYSRFTAAVDAAFGEKIAEPADESPEFVLDRQAALDYFAGYFDFVPDYIELMADEAPRALEGYVLMRQWSLAENILDAKHVELLLCTINAAEFSSRFVNVHANGARNAGATEAEIVESVVCAIPVSGVAAWLPGADGIMEGRS